MPDLNLKYYKQDVKYNTSINEDEHNDLIKYINAYEEKDYNMIFENDQRVSIFNNLSELRSNIINWYPFKKECNILEIGAGFGCITGTLCDKSKKVVSIETNKDNAECIVKRHKSKKNLEVICANLEDIIFDEKFDYITIIGTIEYSDNILNEKYNSFEKLLSFCKKLLKKDGKILLATDNKFGIKYFAGNLINNQKSCFSNITGNIENGFKLYGKNEIVNIIKNNGFDNLKLFYPIPDYKLANVIYSDEYLPDNLDTKIIYNKYYSESSIVLFNELDAYREIIKNKNFADFSNSFFIVIDNENNNSNNKTLIPKFISYNNLRKKTYRLETKIYDEYVTKTQIYAENDEHIKQFVKNTNNLKKLGLNVIDNVENNIIISKFMKEKTLDKLINNLFLSGNVEEACYIINKWYDLIKAKLANKENDFNKLIYIENGYIDLVFENTFFIDDKFIFFDQEWYMTNIPIQFILYRSINNLYNYNIALNNIITVNEILKRFNLLEYIDEFKAIERKLQDMVNDKVIVKFYAKNIGENIGEYISKKNIISSVYLDKIDNLENKLNAAMDREEKLIMEKELIKEKILKINKSKVWKIRTYILNLLGKGDN